MTETEHDTPAENDPVPIWAIAIGTVLFGPLILMPPWGMPHGAVGPHTGLDWWQIPLAWLGVFLYGAIALSAATVTQNYAGGAIPV